MQVQGTQAGFLGQEGSSRWLSDAQRPGPAFVHARTRAGSDSQGGAGFHPPVHRGSSFVNRAARQYRSGLCGSAEVGQTSQLQARVLGTTGSGTGSAVLVRFGSDPGSAPAPFAQG